MSRYRNLALATLMLCGYLLSPAGLAQQGSDYSRDGADTCIGCHDDAVTLALFRGRHAVPGDARGPFGHGQLQCEACHGPGAEHSGRVRRGAERPAVIRFGADSTTDVAQQNAMCTACHDADVGSSWHAGSHASNDVACAACHSSHTDSDPVLQQAAQAEVCFDCHQLQRSETQKAFAHPLAEAKMACTGCHSPHGDSLDTQLARFTVNDTCYACHAEKRGPFLWEHAPVAEDCSLCHAPHGSNHPGMLVQRAPLLCQSCHSQAGHPSIAQTVDGLPAGSPSQFLLGQSCLNCHSQVHGSNHPSGSRLAR